ncbi:hypothetical protein G9A89_015079 [Geosiphon pyriformis]|nr:hypothetical protein G9A89_015079 [Geosiphon pyriformis]
MSNIAYLINFLDCNNSNNVGSKVPGLQIKVHAEFYSYSLDYSALVIMFAGPKLTKKQWASRNSNQVQFRFEGYPGFDPEARVETQLLEDVEMLFPILKETIYDFLSRFPKATKTYEIAFVGHALGGAYAYIAGFRWALERKIIEIASTGWKHSGVEIWIEPLGDCDCSDERNVYWDCNNSLLSQTQRNLWVNGIYSEENMMCNAGQSINEVSESFFHNGPYFNIEMGNCGPSMTNN